MIKEKATPPPYNKIIEKMAKHIFNANEDCCLVCSNRKACNSMFEQNENYVPNYKKCYIYIAEYFSNEANKKQTKS